MVDGENCLFEKGVVEIFRFFVIDCILVLLGVRVCFDLSRSSGTIYHLLYGKSMPIVASTG